MNHRPNTEQTVNSYRSSSQKRKTHHLNFSWETSTNEHANWANFAFFSRSYFSSLELGVEASLEILKVQTKRKNLLHFFFRRVWKFQQGERRKNFFTTQNTNLHEKLNSRLPLLRNTGRNESCTRAKSWIFHHLILSWTFHSLSVGTKWWWNEHKSAVKLIRVHYERQNCTEKASFLRHMHSTVALQIRDMKYYKCKRVGGERELNGAKKWDFIKAHRSELWLHIKKKLFNKSLLQLFFLWFATRDYYVAFQLQCRLEYNRKNLSSFGARACVPVFYIHNSQLT